MIWETVIVQLGDDEYKTVQADGWEPFWCTLIAIPADAPNGIYTPPTNGAGSSANFVKMVGMRKAIDNANKMNPALDTEGSSCL